MRAYVCVCVCVCSGSQETPADEETGQATGTGRELRIPGQMRLLSLYRVIVYIVLSELLIFLPCIHHDSYVRMCVFAAGG